MNVKREKKTRLDWEKSEEIIIIIIVLMIKMMIMLFGDYNIN